MSYVGEREYAMHGPTGDRKTPRESDIFPRKK